MATERRCTRDLNRTIDLYDDGRRFFFYKDAWADRDVVVRETAPSKVTAVITAGADWDIHVATQTAGNFVYMGLMSDVQRRNFNRIMFLEQLVWPAVLATDVAMVADAANDLQRRFAMRGVLNGFQIPDITAESLAQNWIVNSVKPAWDELGLNAVPETFRPILKAA